MKIDLNRFRALAETFAPIILSALGQPQLATITQEAILGVETFAAGGQHTGEQKKSFAMASIGQGLTVLNAVRPGTVPDVLALESVVSEAIDVTVKAINTAHTLTGQTPTAAPGLNVAQTAQGLVDPSQPPPFVPEAPLSGEASVETPNIPGGPR